MTKRIKLTSVFFRFYGRTDDEIKQCLAELKEGGLNPIRYCISDTKQSCNLLVKKKYLPARQLDIYFRSSAEASVIHQEWVGEIYHKWSIPENLPKGELVKRNTGDIAFRLNYKGGEL